MNVERVKYLIWAADVDRAVLFYETLFGAKVTRKNPAVTDLDICGATVGYRTIDNILADSSPQTAALRQS